MRFGIIGCGKISERHTRVLSSLDGVTIAAVCDPVEERARAAAALTGARAFLDHHEMLAAGGLDAVCVLTPSGAHAQPAIDAAHAGCHVVVEKPIALTLDDADRMIRACDQHDVKLFVVKQNRYNTAVQALRRAVDAERFGKLVLGTIRVRWCRTQEYYDKESWRGTWRHDGGVLTNQASHHIDLLEWMMGDVDSVMAMTSTRLVKIEAEDTAVAMLRFRSGALGVIEATTATRPRDLEGSLSILGANGAVELGGFVANEVRTWQFTAPEPGDEDVARSCSQTMAAVNATAHRRFFEDVIACIRDGKTALVDGLEGRRSLELIMAIYESVETGREVPLRFRPRRCRLGL